MNLLTDITLVLVSVTRSGVLSVCSGSSSADYCDRHLFRICSLATHPYRSESSVGLRSLQTRSQYRQHSHHHSPMLESFSDMKAKYPSRTPPLRIGARNICDVTNAPLEPKVLRQGRHRVSHVGCHDWFSSRSFVKGLAG